MLDDTDWGPDATLAGADDEDPLGELGGNVLVSAIVDPELFAFSNVEDTAWPPRVASTDATPVGVGERVSS